MRADGSRCFSSFDRLKWCHQFCEYVTSRLYEKDGGYIASWFSAPVTPAWTVITWARFINCCCGIGCGKNTCLQLLAQQSQTTLSKYRSRLGNITSHYTQQVSHISYSRKKGTCGGGQRETWYTSWCVSWMPKQLFIPTQKKKRIKRTLTHHRT